MERHSFKWRFCFLFFYLGLDDTMKDELAVKNKTNSLDSLITLTIKLDNRLRKCHLEKSHSTAVPSAPFTPRPAPSVPKIQPAPLVSMSALNCNSSPEPKHLARTCPTQAERQRCMFNNPYCSQKGHFITACPVRPKD